VDGPRLFSMRFWATADAVTLAVVDMRGPRVGAVTVTPWRADMRHASGPRSDPRGSEGRSG
jgi:hypothetical protein